MRDLLKRLSKMIVGYGAIQWAGPFLSLIFTPIITRAVSPDDYGVADYLGTIISALATIALVAIPQAITTHFNDIPEDSEWQRSLVGSGLFITSISSLLIGYGLYICSPYIIQFAPLLEPYVNILRLLGVTLFFGVTGLVLTTTAQSALRIRWGMIFSIVTISVTIIGNLLFVVVLRLGATGLILAQVSTGICLWVVAVLLTRKTIGMPKASVVLLLLTSGIVLLPTMTSTWILQLSDRLFLGYSISGTELGHYAIANKMASLVGVALNPIFTAWSPLALAVQHEANAREQYIRMSRYLIAIVLSVSLIIGLFSTEILIILTRPAYLPAAPYVGFLTYVYVFNGFGSIFTTGALMGKQLASISLSVLLGAASNILLNFILIPKYGIWGAVVATVIGYLLPQLALYFILQKRYPIDYPQKIFIIVLLAEFGLMCLGLWIPPLTFPLRMLVKIAIFALLPVIYVVSGLIELSEIKQFYVSISNRLNPITLD